MNSNLNAVLKAQFDAIMDLEKQKQEIADDIKAYYASAKEAELDVKALRAAVRVGKMTSDQKRKREEAEDAIDQYLVALGLVSRD